MVIAKLARTRQAHSCCAKLREKILRTGDATKRETLVSPSPVATMPRRYPPHLLALPPRNVVEAAPSIKTIALARDNDDSGSRSLPTGNSESCRVLLGDQHNVEVSRQPPMLEAVI